MQNCSTSLYQSSYLNWEKIIQTSDVSQIVTFCITLLLPYFFVHISKKKEEKIERERTVQKCDTLWIIKQVALILKQDYSSNFLNVIRYNRWIRLEHIICFQKENKYFSDGDFKICISKIQFPPLHLWNDLLTDTIHNS